MQPPQFAACLLAVVILHGRIQQSSGVVAASENPPLLWPLPSQVTLRSPQIIQLSPNWKCDITIPNSPSTILNDACGRYQAYVKAPDETWSTKRLKSDSVATVVQIKVERAELDTKLNSKTNESYEINIMDGSQCPSIELVANNVFGALRALETFSQLVDGNLTVPHITVIDSPRFQHRELLVDTARYYLNISFLEHIIDAMSFSKLNVLHWHAIDSQSFPIESKKYPLLSEKGQFKPHSHFCASDSCAYSQSDIRGLISYARARGVRVLLEIDTPGHSKSWGNAYKNMTVNFCTLNADSVPLNPTLPFTLDVVTGFVSEMLNGSDPLFPDDFIHLGGDEVDLSCWNKNKNILAYMKKNNLTAATLLSQWIQDVRSRIYGSVDKKNIMYWEDAFNYTSSSVDNTTIFAVWRDKRTLHSIAKAGSQSTLSAGWYIHAQSKWTDFYDNEPFDDTWSTKEKSLVHGGAVSYWGCSGFCPFPYTAEKFDGRTWPVSCAAAERLWSNENVTSHDQALPRLTAHTKRLFDRGVRVGKLK